MNVYPYAKTIVAVVIAGLYALQAALTDGGVTTDEWVGIALAAVGAIGVYAVPNRDPEPDGFEVPVDDR